MVNVRAVQFRLGEKEQRETHQTGLKDESKRDAKQKAMKMVLGM